MFSSQWLTGTGTGDDALRDTGNALAPFTTANVGSGECISVVDGDAYGWTAGNLLQVEMGYDHSVWGSVCIGSNTTLVDPEGQPIPAGVDYYFRVYVNVWNVTTLNDYGGGHPCNTSFTSPYMGLWSCLTCRADASEYNPGFIRARTTHGLSNLGAGGGHGGFWWPGLSPGEEADWADYDSPYVSIGSYVDQQHWYLVEMHVHYLEFGLNTEDQKRWFIGSYGFYDAENNYNKIADLSDTESPMGCMEDARQAGAFAYRGEVTQVDPLIITPEAWHYNSYPWQVMIGCEGNAAQSEITPHEFYYYAAPAVALDGFPDRLPALG